MTREKKNFQINRRTKKLVVPCDKLSNHMWNFSAEFYSDNIRIGVEGLCVEWQDKKGNEIITPYLLTLVEGYEDKLPPDAFTREVLFHAISAYEQGIRVITISTTLDSLTGGKEKRNVYKNQCAAIRDAFDKLAFTRITVDIEPLLKAFPKYQQNYDGAWKIISPLLPCRILEGKLNGQPTLLVELLAESPLMTVAKLKNQLITYDATPLAIANQNNTRLVITTKSWLLRRIKLIERGLNNSILIETAETECGLANANKWQKQDFRELLSDILSSFKADGVIKDFEFERRGRAYRAIKITL